MTIRCDRCGQPHGRDIDCGTFAAWKANAYEAKPITLEALLGGARAMVDGLDCDEETGVRRRPR